MASTFSGNTFQTVRSGNTLTVDAAEADVAETRIPGSNINILDVGGLRPSRITRTIKIDRANVGTWRGLRLTLGELVLIGVSYGSCLLEQLTNHEEEATETCDYFQATWVQTS